MLYFLILLQKSFFQRLTGDNKSEKFFKVFYERMKLAQQEIKATVSVNTSDLGSKKKEEEPPDKDAPSRNKGEGSGDYHRLEMGDHIPKGHVKSSNSSVVFCVCLRHMF